VNVYLLPNENIKNHQIYILIDLLRATSSISALLHCGAEEIFVTDDINVAKELKNMGYLLAGERGAIKLEGFDFDNSPLEFLNNSDKIRKKSILLITSNGTKAMKKINELGDIIAISLLNFSSVVDFIIQRNFQSIGVVCSGTNGSVSFEDSYLAGLFVQKIMEKNTYNLNDGARISLNLTNSKKSNIMNSDHAKRLKNLGLKDDLEFCFNMDLFQVVPYSKQNSYTFKNLISI
jgi:2-phosphosulfolactate phosphatase